MNRSRLLDWIRARLGAQIVPSLDHAALYPGRVVAQNGQAVDVECDDGRIGSLSRVPLQLGIPGGEVTIPAGARVLVGWKGGDARYPYATTWEAGATVTELRITATSIVINSGTKGAARTDDEISVGAWQHIPASGAGVTPCQLKYIPPGGVLTTIDPLGTQVTGKITGGSSSVDIG